MAILPKSYALKSWALFTTSIFLSMTPSFASIRASNSTSGAQHTTPPVAVFVGGTSGIGEGITLAFAEHTKGKSHIIIVGRKKDAAERIFSEMPKPSGTTKYAREFIQCDVMLLKNVHKATKDILEKYPKINYLIMTPGIAAIGGRDETEEGIEKRLALHYYARWKFLHDLLPALKNAKDEGERVAAMSVYSTGKGGPIDIDDLDLKNGSSITRAALVGATYNDLMMETFSQQAPTIPFIHAYPGFVRSPLMSSSSSVLVRSFSAVILPLTRPLSVTGRECGEYMWHAIYHTVYGSDEKSIGRAWRTGSHGEDLGMKNYFGDEEQRRKVWEHTDSVVTAACGDNAA